MKFKSFRNSNSNKNFISNKISNLKQKSDNLFSKYSSLIKENKRKSNDLILRKKVRYNSRNDYHRINFIDDKKNIKHILESNINLSENYKNFCGSFLYPSYHSRTKSRIINDLKSFGAKRTVNKHFFIDFLSPSKLIKNKIYNINKKNLKSMNQSRYYSLINSSSLLDSNNNIIGINNKKYLNDNYFNKSFKNKKNIFKRYNSVKN